MSAKAKAATVELDDKPNGENLWTGEEISHDFGHVGKLVLAECCVCCTNTNRRLLDRDYTLQDDFKPVNDDEYVPAAIWRHCDECGSEETHFVC